MNNNYKANEKTKHLNLCNFFYIYFNKIQKNYKSFLSKKSI
jgi:hypothetical protein